MRYGLLREWRRDDGRKPEQIAVAAGISCSYLSAMERGVAGNPSYTLLTRLCGVYGHSVGELFDDDLASTA